VNEFGAETNNVLSSVAPIHILPNNAARLGVSSVIAGSSVTAGEALAVSWTVVNSGNGTTNAPWMDGVVLSTNPVYVPGGGYILDLYPHRSNVVSGGSYSQSQSVNVPVCFSGTYYLTVVADISNIVNSFSCDTNNFETGSSPVQVAPAPYPNLELAGITLPATVTSTVPWVVQWSVTNAGGVGASGSWFDAVYASSSPVLNENGYLLGQFAHNGGLPAGAGYGQSQLVQFPACTSGQYYIVVVADVSNVLNQTTVCQPNNAAISSNALSVNFGTYPDLMVSSISIPATATADQLMTVSWTVTNAGAAAANAPWVDSVYLTPSSYSLESAILLGSSLQTISLPSGGTYTQMASFTPPNIHGMYYVTVYPDATNALQECLNESKNIAASASTVNIQAAFYPDLKVTNVQAPATAYAGQTITVSWQVVNEGNAPAGPPAWNDAVYVSEDEVLASNAVRLGAFAHANTLGVGQSYSNSATVVLPPGYAGPYFILILADSGGALYEHLGYNDSLGSNPEAMLVSLAPGTQLAPGNVTLTPASGVPGTPASIEWQVSNVGGNNTVSTWADAVYLSTNNFWDITATLLTSVNHTGLAASASYSASWSGSLPALTPGSYYALVRTDVRDSVPEISLSNLVAVSPNTISVDVPVLVLGQTVSNQLTTGAAQYYKVNCPAGQTVGVTLTGASSSSFNELYVRFGGVPDLGDYDFIYSDPLAPNQEIQIPTTQAGWYYIMVRGGSEPGGPLGYSLTANTIPFAISQVTPNFIGDNGQVTLTVQGALFQLGETVQLVSGTKIYSAQTNFFTNATTVLARFLFTNAVHGIYDVVLTNPGNQSTTDPQAVTIETALPLTSQVITAGQVNFEPRVGLPFNWAGAVANAGNVDIEYITVELFLDKTFPIALAPPSEAVLADTDSTTNSGNVCFFIARDLAPGGSLNFSFEVSGFFDTAFYYFVSPRLQTKQNFLAEVADYGESLRQYMLNVPDALDYTVTNTLGVIMTNIWTMPTNLLEVLLETNQWEMYFAEGFVTNGLLDSGDLNSLPSPDSLDSSGGLFPQIGPRALPRDAASCDQCIPNMLGCFLTGGLRDAATGVVSGLRSSAELSAVAGIARVAGRAGAGLLIGIIICEGEALSCEYTSCINPPPQGPCAGPPPPLPSLPPLPMIGYINGQQVIFFPPDLNPPSPPGPGGGASGGGCPEPSRDPNEKDGPVGYSAAGFVGSQVPWLYTIYCENDSNALAFARQVSITDYFNPSFDIRTFRLGNIVIGSNTISVPTNRTYYQTQIALGPPNPTNVVADITAGVDVQSGSLFWTMNAIDLNTGQLVTQTQEGVLPPNTSNNIGAAYVTYTIKPLAGVPTGTVITNQASIIFDINDPIATDITTNTVDALPPTSSVALLPAQFDSTNFTVSWSGMDDAGGSGVANYSIYFSDDGGPFQIWLSDATTNSAQFTGQFGHNYAFYSMAQDNAGNIEAPHPTPDTTTTIRSQPIITPVANQTINAGTTLVITNTVTDAETPAPALTFTLGPGAPAGAAITPNGIFTWTPPCADGGTTNLIDIVVTASDNPTQPNSVMFSVIVGYCATAVIWTNPAPITYGAALTTNQLNATANVPGSFAYYPTNGTVPNTGTNTLSVIFTPTDTVDYTSLTNTVSLVVRPALLTVTAANTNRAYGQPNPAFAGTIVGVTNGDNITATYTCSAANNSPVGMYAIVPSLVDPGDRQTNYMVNLVNATLTVTEETPVVTWTNPATVIYGAALTTNQLNATASVLGNFAYSPTNGSVLNTGTNTLLAIFTPADTVDYTSVTNTVSQVVAPAALTVTAANTNRAYGQPNPPFTGTLVGVTNGDNITAAYTCSAATNSPVETYAIVPSLVDPSNRQTNYTVSLINGTLTITQAMPVITWTNPALIIYGAALTTNQLNATASVPGAFAYNPTNGTVLNTGTNTLSVIFTPADTGDYISVTNTVSLVVSPAALTVTAANTNRAYGQPNPLFTGTFVGVTNGDNITAAYSCSADTNSPVGTYAIEPSLVDPSDRQTNYAVSLLNGTLTVTQSAPVVTWTNPTAIIYGAALTTNQLNATARVLGGFAYNPTNGTVLDTGTNTLTVIFTPADTVDYISLTNTVSLVVVPVALTVTAANTNRAYGQANPPFTGTIVGVTNEDNITAGYSSSAVTNSPVGTYAIVPSLLDPDDRQTNYTLSLINGTLTVTAPPVIQSVQQTGNSFTFAWSAAVGVTYQIQYTTNLAQNAWTNFGSPMAATNSIATASDTISNSQKFYRVLLLP
jgi:hypothetical protein